MIYDIFHYLKTSDAKKHCYMAAKTNMSKVYDQLKWDFVRLVFEKLGFDSIWINWVMQCISTVSYSFLVNNSVVGHVVPQRKIKQGDPFFSYIFIFCGKVLSRQNSGKLSGVKIGHHYLRINHFLLADDTMFFTKTTSEKCSFLVLIFKDYEHTSGQLISATKSFISFSSKTP